MATVIQVPRKGEGLKQAIGQGIGNFVQKTAEGYQTRADEMALQKAVSDLGPKASPQEVLKAITGTHTYSPAAKQNALKNYVGIAEYEDAKAKRQAVEEQNNIKNAQRDRALDIQEERLDKTAKDQKTASNIKAGLQTVKEMKDLGKKGNLGRGSNILKVWGGETAKDYAQYEQLGKSLIQLSTTIPIRNRQEFETLAHNLYDPSLPDSAREGILNAMENILNRSLQSEESNVVQDVAKDVQSTGEKIRVKNKLTGQTGTIPLDKFTEDKYERI